MKNKKTLIILAIVLVALIVASVIVLNLDNYKEKVRAEAGTIMQFKGADITEFSWKYDKTDFHFAKQDGKWIVPEDELFPVQQDKVNSLLAQIQNFQTSFTIEKPDKLATYGLKNPKCSITVKTVDKDYTMDFGDLSGMDGLRYTNVGDGNVYLATDDVMDKFNLTIYNLLQYDVFPQCYRVTDFILEGANNTHIYYDDENVYSYSDQYRYYVKKNGTYMPLNTLNASNFIGYLTGYELVDYVTFEADNDGLAQYGLDDPDLTITAKYLLKSDSVEKSEVVYYLSKESDAVAYINMKGSPIVYRMDPKDYDYFATTDYDVLKATELALLNPENIDKMVVSMDNKNFTVNFNHDANKTSTTYVMGGEEIDLTELMKQLKKTAVADFEESSVGSKTIAIRLYGSDYYNSRLVEVYNSTSEHSVIKVDGQYFGRTTRKDAQDLVEAFVKVFEAE